MRGLAILSVVAIAGSRLCAQSPAAAPRVGLGAGVSLSALDGAMWGATVVGSLRPAAGPSRWRLQAGVSFAPAPKDSVLPSVLMVTADGVLRASGSPAITPHAAVFFSAGIAAAHFNADLNQALVAACTPPACLEPPPRFDSGWRWMVAPGIGLDLPVSGAIWIRPHGRVFVPVGSGGGRGGTALLRLDVTAEWRPSRPR